jgi:tRNA nucleotidyltransferase (CCA-adding enzyme)
MFDWLQGPEPHKHLHAMHADGRLAKELPQVEQLYGVPQRAEHHPEVDTGAHIELCLAAAAALDASPAARFAVLLHDLGKAVTDKDKWPGHVDHETLGVPLVEAVCNTYGIDGYERKLALLVCEHHLNAHRSFDMRPRSVITLLEEHGLLADKRLLNDFIVACESDARGRLGKHDSEYRQGVYLRNCAEALQLLPKPSSSPDQSREWQDKHRARLEAVRRVHHQLTSAKPAESTMC